MPEGITKRDRSPDSKVEKGPSLRLEELDEFFKRRPELIEEIKKVFSISMRRAFISDYETHTRGPYRHTDPYREPLTDDNSIKLRSFEEMLSPPPSYSPESKTWVTDRKKFLSDSDEKRYFAEIVLASRETDFSRSSACISLVFSVHEDTARRYWSEGMMHGKFTAPKDMRFHGVYIGTPGKEKRVLLSEAIQNGKFAGSVFDRASFDAFVEELNQPIVECKEALAEIDRLGLELGIDATKIEALKASVRDYASYFKPEPTTGEQCFREIGQCFGVPYVFQQIAKEWHGLKVDTDSYSHSAYGESTFFHQVNVFEGQIVVDWTARQYRQFDNEPYPFVYRVGDERVKTFGSLRYLEMKNETHNKVPTE